MALPAKSKVITVSLVLVFFLVIGFSGYLLFQNYWWKQEAVRYAESSARLEAQGMFRHNTLCVFKMDGQCDEPHFSGQFDGPFQVWVVFYQPTLGEAHRFVTERWVETFNEQMRLMQRQPEKFRKNMGLDKEASKVESK